MQNRLIGDINYSLRADMFRPTKQYNLIYRQKQGKNRFSAIGYTSRQRKLP